MNRLSNYRNIAKAKAIENQNKKRLLKVNPKLNERSGIYFLLREDEKSADYLSALSTYFLSIVTMRLLKLLFCSFASLLNSSLRVLSIFTSTPVFSLETAICSSSFLRIVTYTKVIVKLYNLLLTVIYNSYIIVI